MEDKKPCDDIFEGLAELLLNNGEIKQNIYNRTRVYNNGICDVYTAESWDIAYGGYIYFLKAHDGVIDSIKRVCIESEGE